MRAVCEHCFRMSLVWDDHPVECDFKHEDEEKIKEWIGKHKKSCDGNIVVLDSEGNVINNRIFGTPRVSQ